MQFLIACARGPRRPRPHGHRRAGGTAGHPALDRRPRRPAQSGRRGAGLAAGPPLRRRGPRGVQGGFRAGHRGATILRFFEQLPPPTTAWAFDLYVPDDHESRRPPAEGVPHRAGRSRWPVPCRSSPPLGIEVLDERPYQIEASSGREPTRPGSTISACGCPRGSTSTTREPPHVVGRASGCSGRGRIEQDGFNALVVRTGLTWWQVNVLRAYTKYLRQAGSTFSQDYVEQCAAWRPHRHQDSSRSSRPASTRRSPPPHREAATGSSCSGRGPPRRR